MFKLWGRGKRDTGCGILERTISAQYHFLVIPRLFSPTSFPCTLQCHSPVRYNVIPVLRDTGISFPIRLSFPGLSAAADADRGISIYTGDYRVKPDNDKLSGVTGGCRQKEKVRSDVPLTVFRVPSNYYPLIPAS